MTDYNIGDVIKLKNDNNSLFMVVDVVNDEKIDTEKNTIGLVFFETMKIFPVARVSHYQLVNSNEIMMHTKNGITEHKILLQFIKKEREKRGWFDIPDYIQVAEKNIVNNIASTSKNVRETKMLPKKVDAIRYDKMNNIDECLDAINDLNLLYKMFGDESYIQLKDLVIERLKAISVK